jgi:acetolactate synthase I/II/III large subunit
VAQIDDPTRIPEFVARAFTLATSGRPGPVALALPEDMLRETASVADADPFKTVHAHPSEADMARLREMLAGAARPVMLLGGSTWTAQAVRDIMGFAEANRLATDRRVAPSADDTRPALRIARPSESR